MSNVASDPPPRDPGNVLPYSTPMRRSRLALCSMVLGIIAIPTAFVAIGIALGIVALILGVMALIAMSKDDYLGGKGFAMTGIGTGIAACVVVPALVIPIVLHAKELSNRAACAASLNGIAKAALLYGNSGMPWYPTVLYAPYSAALNNPSGVAAAFPSSVGNPSATVGTYFASSPPNLAGSPMACLWMLDLYGNVGPKQFICRSDPFVLGPAKETNTSGNFYDNFQNGTQLSYSVMYPWDSGGNVLPAWQSTVDSSLPILSDMAPLNGTGNPTRVLNGPKSAYRKTLNSSNHNGEGQNVAFSDTHVEWAINPYVGQGGDNIWTVGGGNFAGGAATGGTPITPGPISIAPSPENTTDTVMVPVRNATTGGM